MNWDDSKWGPMVGKDTNVQLLTMKEQSVWTWWQVPLELVTVALMSEGDTEHSNYVGVTWRWVTLRGQAWAPPYCVQRPGLEEAWQQWLRAHWPGWNLFIQKVPPKNSSCWNQGLPVDGSGFSEFLSVLGVGRRLLQNSKPLEFLFNLQRRF